MPGAEKRLKIADLLSRARVGGVEGQSALGRPGQIRPRFKHFHPTTLEVMRREQRRSIDPVVLPTL